jgi:hypothetical protein
MSVISLKFSLLTPRIHKLDFPWHQMFVAKFKSSYFEEIIGNHTVVS